MHTATSTGRSGPRRLGHGAGRLASIAAAMLAGAWSILACASPAAAVTDEEVGEAIEKLTKFLYSKQNAQGHWDPEKMSDGYHTYGMQHGGTSALAAYALLASGQSYQEPRMRKAIAALEGFEPRGVYQTGLRMHVWNQLPDSFEPQMRKDLSFLLTCPIAWGDSAVAFGYGPGLGSWSNSRTQYGTLGLWEGAKRGHNVPADTWQRLERHFIATQQADGGWPYARTTTSTVAMTAAGLTAMFIIEDYVHTAAFREPGRGANHPIRDRIDKGLDYFSKHWKPGTDTPGRGRDFVGYHLYGTERVGLASGRKHFGGQDWFRSGAELIVKNLGKNGAFNTPGGGGSTTDTVRSSFALLFLARGRVPVLGSKLEIPGWDWNNRPRDLANLAAWVSDTAEQPMNWQIVSIDSDVREWMDAPILYLAGHRALELSDERKAKIKRYIDLGGLLITAADTSSREFTVSVERLLRELYPRYPMRALAPGDELAKLVFQPDLQRLAPSTVSNGARHLAIHLPRGDVSWVWHSRSHTDPAAWQFMINAYNYASEKGRVRNRLAEHVVTRNEDGGGPEATVARARYKGNWNPEPLAWTVQADRMFNDRKATLEVIEADLAELPDPSAVAFVHVAGTEALSLSEAQIASIKRHAEAGGRVLFENVGGHGEFVRSVMSDLLRAYPGQRFRVVGSESPLLSGEGVGGFDATAAAYRPYVVLRAGNVTTPSLIALHIDGEPRIIVSGDDLTVAMLNQPTWGVYGYTSDTAYRLMSNLVLSGSKKDK